MGGYGPLRRLGLEGKAADPIGPMAPLGTQSTLASPCARWSPRVSGSNGVITHLHPLAPLGPPFYIRTPSARGTPRGRGRQACPGQPLYLAAVFRVQHGREKQLPFEWRIGPMAVA